MADAGLIYTDHPASTPDAPLWNVTLANGATVPMAVDRQALDDAGGVYQPAGAPPPTMVDSGAVAGPGGGEEAGYEKGAIPHPAEAPTPWPVGGVPTPEAPVEKAAPVAAPSPAQAGVAQAAAQAPPPAAPAAPRARVNASGAAPPAAGPGAPAAGGDPAAEAAREYYRQQVTRPSYGGGQRVPEAWVPGSRRTELGIAPSEDARAAIADASINQELERQAETEPAARDQLIAARREELQGQEEQRQIDADKVRRAGMNQHLESLQRAYHDRMAEVPQIDPGKFYRDQGVLGTIMSAIFVGLGAQSQALLGHGPNTAKEIEDAAIEREMQAQKSAVEVALARGETARNEWADALQMYGSPELADKEFRARAAAVNDKMAHAYALRSGVPEIQQAYDRWHAEHQVARAEQDAGFDQAAQAHVVETSQFQPAHTVGGGGGPVDPVTAAERSARLAKALRYVDQGDQPTGRAAMAQQSRQQAQAAAKARLDARLHNIDEAERLGNVHGSSVPGTPQYIEAESARQRVARDIQQDLGKSDNDAALADQIAVNPHDLRGSSIESKARKNREQALQKYREEAAAAGLDVPNPNAAGFKPE